MTTTKEPEQMKNLPWPTDEEHPRRLLRLPDGVLVGFGGGDAIYQLAADDESTVLRQWEDDAVKALAVSPDGKRVAVGFDSGMTQIYAYDSYTAPDPHPFASKAGDSTSFCTECAEAPVRNLQFHPTNDYLLAIATESALMVLDARSEESASTSNDEFAQLVAEHHDDAGIRSVDFKKSTKENKVLLSSLGMDGRHCLWDATTSEPSEWKLIHRDAAQCITKRDVGEVLGAEVWERACRPAFCNNIIILPGEAFLQLRWVQASSTVVDCDMTNTEHKDLVVVAATRGRSIVTGGRDGRVLLWRMEPGNDGEPPRAVLVRQLVQIESFATDLLWDTQGDLYVSTASGEVTVVRAVTGKPVQHVAAKEASKSTATSASKETTPATAKEPEAASSPVIKAKTSPAPSSPPDDDSDDEAEATFDDETPEKPNAKRATKSSTTPAALDFESDEDDDVVTSRAATPEKSSSINATQASPSSPPRSKKTAVEDSDSEDDNVTSPKATKKTGSSIPPTQASPSSPHRFNKAATENDNSDDEDIDFTQSSSAAKKPSFVLDEADDDEDSIKAGPDTPDATQADKTTGHNDSDDVPMHRGDDDLMNDMRLDDADGDDDSQMSGDFHPTAQPAWNLPKPQAAFAPSSTPLDLSHRILCWNHIGTATWNSNAHSRGTVDIHFTAAAFRRPVSFTDNLGFILGSIGEEGAIFATDLLSNDDEEDDDDELGDLGYKMNATKAVLKKNKNSGKSTGSMIYFNRFETMSSIRDKDWYLTLPHGERVLGCATGEGWAAAITSRRFLRLFSSGGNQGKVLWLDGEPVTMAGRDRFVAVFYHESSPLPDGSQKLGYLLYDAIANRTIAKGPVSCLSTGASLAWAGFCNQGSLVTLDSSGMLSMLVCPLSGDEHDSHNNWEWVPMLDTVGLRKSSDDSHWPITVHDGKLVCVPLRGGTKHPDASRRPVTTTLGFRMPLARGVLTQANVMEELSVRADLALSQKKVLHDIANGEDEDDDDFEKEYSALSAQVDKVVLKLFNTTVEAGKLERALDLVGRLHMEQSYDIASKLADSHRKHKLVNLIEEAKEERFGGGQDDDEESLEATPATTANAYDRRRISPDSSERLGKRSFHDDSNPRQVRGRRTYA